MSDLEVREAFWSLREDKVPRPDGFSHYWSIIREEVLKMVQVVFHSMASMKSGRR